MSLTKVCYYWIDLSRIEMVGPLDDTRGTLHDTYYTVYMFSGVTIELSEEEFQKEKLLKMIKEAGPKLYFDGAKSFNPFDLSKKPT